MSLGRLLLALCSVAMNAGCGSAEAGPERLATNDRAAYLILLDQLNQLPDRLVDPTRRVNLCVNASSAFGDQFHIDELFLEELRAEIPAELSATLMLASECIEQDGVGPYFFPDGNPAWELSVYLRPRIMGDGDQWTGTVTCGGLCGWGNAYRIDFHLGHMSVTRTGDLFS